MRLRWILLLSLLTLLVASYVVTGVTQVQPGERAVIRRFGRVLDEKPGAGLLFGLPWGMDQVDRVAIEKVRRVDVGYDPESDPGSLDTPAGQLLTGDHNIVNVRAILNYTIIEEQVENYVAQSDRVDGLVNRAAETIIAEWIAGRTIDDILITAKAALPAELIQKTQERLGPYHLGIRVQGASVVLTRPPDQVKTSFDDVTQAQTGIQTRVNQADDQALRALRGAEGNRTKILNQAQAEANAMRSAAQADAAAFLARLGQYLKLRKNNPNLLAGIWYDEIGSLFESLKKAGRIDLLDHHLAGDELNIMQMPAPQKRKP
ncbi:MAG TPA: SPFH domain-containing protein [Gemmataceae bacterium]|jgi:membrane protease subunit HflK|nr:SPFH domain-containing protein [Gemmataceae bacterium]